MSEFVNTPEVKYYKYVTEKIANEQGKEEELTNRVDAVEAEATEAEQISNGEVLDKSTKTDSEWDKNWAKVPEQEPEQAPVIAEGGKKRRSSKKSKKGGKKSSKKSKKAKRSSKKSRKH